MPEDHYEHWTVRDKSLDELIDDYESGVAEGAGMPGGEVLSVGLQYHVAKAQERWTRVSAGIAGASVVVAIAAVVVAAIK